ncbi:MAG: site-2 protease family protein [Pseudomonadota bacterium]
MSIKRVTLFHFFGFRIKADASWLLLAVLVSWTMSNKVYPDILPGQSPDIYQFMGIATVAGVFFSIVAHEVAHAVIAEYYHMPIESITLFIFGGVSEMKGQPSHPKGEFFMAISGPIMSALLGLVFWAVASLYETYVRAGPVSCVLAYHGDLNMFIAVFNMAPAFPLDGGRAMRALIWHYKNNLVAATRISSESGAIFAYGLITCACFSVVLHNDMVSGMWLGLLGFFVYNSSAYAVRQMESSSLLALEKVSRFMHNRVVAVSPDLTIADLVDQYVNRHYQKNFPVIDNGILTGIISLNAVMSLNKHEWPFLHVASVMGPLGDFLVVAPESSAADALEIMHRHGQEQLLVADKGRFLGVITFRDLTNFLAITLKIDHNKPVEKSRTAHYQPDEKPEIVLPKDPPPSREGDNL